jgi:hypothetical protein
VHQILSFSSILYICSLSPEVIMRRVRTIYFRISWDFLFTECTQYHDCVYFCDCCALCLLGNKLSDFRIDMCAIKFFTHMLLNVLTESRTATFGPGPGLITYYFLPNSLPSRSSDRLAFGFRTVPNLPRQVTLVRVESQTGTDFIEVEIVSQMWNSNLRLQSLKHYKSESFLKNI